MKQVVVEFCRPRKSFLGFLAHFALWLAHKCRWDNVPTMIQIKTYDKQRQEWEGFEIDGTCVRAISSRPDPFAVSRVFMTELYLSEDMFRTVHHYLRGSTRPWPTFAERFSLLCKRVSRVFGFKIQDVFSPARNAERSCEAALIAIGNLEDFKPLLEKYDPLTVDCCDIMQLMIEGGA